MMSVLFLALAALPGCVAWEIRDDLRRANTQLEEVDKSLTGTNEQIAEVERGLARLDDTNTSLGSVEEQLAYLRSIEASLGRLDQHLASLRRTISRIDRTIPFLDLGGGDPPPPEPPVADAADEPEARRPARDPLLGTWLSEFPTEGFAMVLLEGGEFVLTPEQFWGPAEGILVRGTWKREESRLTLTPRNAGPDAAAAVLAIVTYSARSITLEHEGRLLIFTRP